jgi:hypothetical protein
MSALHCGSHDGGFAAGTTRLRRDTTSPESSVVAAAKRPSCRRQAKPAASWPLFGG